METGTFKDTLEHLALTCPDGFGLFPYANAPVTFTKTPLPFFHLCSASGWLTLRPSRAQIGARFDHMFQWMDQIWRLKSPIGALTFQSHTCMQRGSTLGWKHTTGFHFTLITASRCVFITWGAPASRGGPETDSFVTADIFTGRCSYSRCRYTTRKMSKLPTASWSLSSSVEREGHSSQRSFNDVLKTHLPDRLVSTPFFSFYDIYALRVLLSESSLKYLMGNMLLLE